MFDENTTRAVLFDYGLTLVTFDYPRDALLEVLTRFRPEISQVLGRAGPDAETIMTQVLEPLEADLERFGEDEVHDYLRFYGAAWQRAGLTLPDDLLFRILDAEQQCWDRAVQVAPGAFEVLAALRKKGIRTVVVSNAPFPPAMMRRQLRGNGIAERVDAVVLSAEVGRRKPARELYEAALAAVEVEPKAALFVGDRYLEDYVGPLRLGMRAVLCTELARQTPPEGVPAIRSLRELQAIL